MKTRKILFLLSALLISFAVSANPDSTQVRRKRVGVVFSGGGAKGVAHVGVLKVLEKAGIPIDIVTGTSMGSIVGGLYAIGYNAHAQDSLFRMQNWGYLISDKENLRNQSLSDIKKQNTYVFTTGMTFGKRDRSGGGLIKGTNLGELFRRLCIGYNDSLDFNKDLCIPFSCVATNIIDNSEVDFHSGRLAQAMRASMAIPGAFAPVRIGNMVLVDGGLKNNYPADIAREMGADIIIGITVQGDPKTADDIGGTMSIIGQIIDVNCKNKVEDNLAITDLHLKVDVHGYGTASFNTEAIDTLIQRGEDIAMEHWDDIMALKKKIGIDDSFRPVIHQPLRPQVLTEKLHVVGYTFENMTPAAERFIRQKFHLSKNDSIDAKMEQELTTTLRVDLFYQTAECRLVPEGDGVRVVLSAGNRKSMQLYVGARFDIEEYAALQLGLDVPVKAAIPISTDVTVRLGKRISARGAFTVHPRSFTRPMLSYTFYRNDIDVYRHGDLNYNVRFNQSQAELLPFNFNLRHFNLQMGLRWDYMHFVDKLSSGESQKVEFDNQHYFSYRARITFNSEDNWYFPTRGARFKAEYSYLTDDFVRLNGSTGMSDVNANWRMSFTIGKRFTLQPMLYGRLLFGAAPPVAFGNIIGGEWFGHYMEQQMPFAGVGKVEYVKRHFVAAQLQAQERLGRNHYVLLRLAGAMQADEIENLFDDRVLFGVQAAYYYNSIFGPVGAAFGYSNRTKKVDFYLNLGYEF